MSQQATNTGPVAAGDDDDWIALAAERLTDDVRTEYTALRRYYETLPSGLAEHGLCLRLASATLLSTRMSTLLAEARAEIASLRRERYACHETPKPSQDQEIPTDQLAALVAGVPPSTIPWWPSQVEDLRDAARLAYRTGYAAALGYEITVEDDRVHIGDRFQSPTQAEDGAQLDLFGEVQ